MSDFMKFLDEKVRYFPMHVVIAYCKILGWTIYITKQGCAKDYPNSRRSGDDAVIVNEQDEDMELCFAKAHVALKEWFINNVGGY